MNTHSFTLLTYFLHYNIKHPKIVYAMNNQINSNRLQSGRSYFYAPVVPEVLISPVDNGT